MLNDKLKKMNVYSGNDNPMARQFSEIQLSMKHTPSLFTELQEGNE